MNVNHERNALILFIQKFRPDFERAKLEAYGQARGNAALENVLDTLRLAAQYEVQFQFSFLEGPK